MVHGPALKELTVELERHDTSKRDTKSMYQYQNKSNYWHKSSQVLTNEQ